MFNFSGQFSFNAQEDMWGIFICIAVITANQWIRFTGWDSIKPTILSFILLLQTGSNRANDFVFVSIFSLLILFGKKIPDRTHEMGRNLAFCILMTAGLLLSTLVSPGGVSDEAIVVFLVLKILSFQFVYFDKPISRSLVLISIIELAFFVSRFKVSSDGVAGISLIICAGFFLGLALVAGLLEKRWSEELTTVLLEAIFMIIALFPAEHGIKAWVFASLSVIYASVIFRWPDEPKVVSRWTILRLGKNIDKASRRMTLKSEGLRLRGVEYLEWTSSAMGRFASVCWEKCSRGVLVFDRGQVSIHVLWLGIACGVICLIRTL